MKGVGLKRVNASDENEVLERFGPKWFYDMLASSKSIPRLRSPLSHHSIQVRVIRSTQRVVGVQAAIIGNGHGLDVEVRGDGGWWR